MGDMGRKNLEEARESYKNLGDKRGEAACLASLAQGYFWVGATDMAMENAKEAQTLYEDAGDDQNVSATALLIDSFSAPPADADAAEGAPSIAPREIAPPTTGGVAREAWYTGFKGHCFSHFDSFEARAATAAPPRGQRKKGGDDFEHPAQVVAAKLHSSRCAG